MMALQYRTRGDLSPTNKARVYLCCHPDDRDLYLKSIAAEILEQADCAVWYREGDEETAADLTDFQLLVVPVTERFLLQPNLAREELVAAREKHIPILPLMQQSGLDEVFNHVCGELQYLDATKKDHPGGAYQRQMDRFLRDVLLEPGKKDMIRKEFDGTIFLSYRKMDRRHAEKLIALIHKQEICRDMAIWYDEYLTPGEDFNQNIRDALEKSDLFVLAVTPNILKKVKNEQGEELENYVVREEYKAANGQKPILPVQMVATDRAKLEEKFPNLESCVSWKDQQQLGQKLAEKLKKIPLRKKTGPMHDYLIGVAYLAGVDVEVNYERALELIQSAAERDCIDAICQLERMYNTGFGVERSYETALYWQSKLVDVLWENHLQAPTPESLLCCVQELWRFGQTLAEYGYTKEANTQFIMARERLQNSQWTTSDEAQELLAQLYLAQAQIALYLDPDQAKDLIRKHIEIVDTLVKKTGQLRYKRMLPMAKMWYGDAFLGLQQYDKARRAYTDSRQGHHQLWEHTADPKDRGNEGVAWERLADLECKEERWDEAMVALQKSHQCAELMDQVLGMEQTANGIALTKGRMGDVCINQGKKEEGIGHYRDCLQVLQKLAKRTGTPLASVNLATAYGRLGDSYRADGQWADAGKCYHYARRLLVKVLNQVQVPRWRRNLGTIYSRLGEMYVQMNNRRQALKWQNRTWQYFNAICEEMPQPQSLDDLAYASLALGRTLKGKSGVDKLILAHNIWYLLWKDAPQVMRYRDNCENVYLEILERQNPQ